MIDTPLNQDAVEATAKALYTQKGKSVWFADWDRLHPRVRAEYCSMVENIVSDYLAVAQPVVTSVEELDALPAGTCFVEPEGGHDVVVKRTKLTYDCVAHAVTGLPPEDIELPATVIFRPVAGK